MITTEIVFQDKLTSTVSLVESIKTLTVTTAPEFAAAKEKLERIRTLEKELEAEYKEHPIIVEARKVQTLKGDIAKMLEDARKYLKNGPMLAYELAEEEKRQAEERRIATELKRKADEEAAARAEQVRQEAEKVRQIAEDEQRKRDEEAAAKVETARKEAEAARKRADAARKRGDDEAAAKAEAARKEAEARRRDEEAERKRQAESAAIAAEAARREAEAEAQRIEKDAAEAAPVTVIIEKTAPTVSRRKIQKYRFKREDKTGVKLEYLMPDEVKIGKVVRALGKAAEQTVGGIEVYEEAA